MKRVIITGGTGFIGKNLVRKLLFNQCKVIMIVRDKSNVDNDIILNRNVKLIETNICDINNIIDPEFSVADVFYHLAWEGASGKNRSDIKIQLKNIENSIKCLDFAERNGILKFVSVGTIGERIPELDIPEKIRSENYLYALSKMFLKHTILNKVSTSNTKTIWCTLGGVYGEGDKTTNLINNTIRLFVEGKTPEFGPGMQLFDFIHIDDCVEGLYLIGENKNHYSNYYLGSGKPQLLKEYLYKIRDLINPNLEIGIGVKNDDSTRYLLEWFDTSRMYSDFMFVPKISFEDGIDRLVKKISKN